MSIDFDEEIYRMGNGIGRICMQILTPIVLVLLKIMRIILKMVK